MATRLLMLGTLLFMNLIMSGCAPLVVGGAVATTATVAHDRRTTGSQIEDKAIKGRIKAVFADDVELSEQSHINIATFNGIVLLSGEAPTEALQARAGELARKAEKVRRVHNEIKIAAPSSYMTRSSDSWLTVKVKSSLVGLDIDGFDPLRVKVVSENGTVYLLGLVYHHEADAVVEKARQVGGVQRIVKLFEYLD